MNILFINALISQAQVDSINITKTAKIAVQFQDLLINSGLSESLSKYLQLGVFIVAILLLAFISDIITRKVLITFIKIVVKRTKTTLDDIFLENKVFDRLSHLAPAVLIYYTIKIALDGYDADEIIKIIRSASSIYMILIGLLVVDSVFNALVIIYRRLPIAKNIYIKGYVQVIKIIFYLIGIVWIFSIIIGFELGSFFTGLGAFVAVLILVFKDTILGFVASIQLSSSNMIKIGDWISMPSHNADGTIEDISVYTVKVRNWNKTISTIPTYAMVSESFSNWRGMQESGGRRIKRSINIDMKSVKFCTPDMIEKYKNISLISSYMEEALERVDKYNKDHNIDVSINVNGKRLTNIGTFRKYIEAYLHDNDKIHDDMTFLVRQLQPTEKGLPIEIYVFSNDQAWENYESIQSDIFDHLLAIIPEFGLRIFQNPTGDDFQKLIN
ncbi:mechanosensitive ion channel family protein [Bacteroidota bacterium]